MALRNKGLLRKTESCVRKTSTSQAVSINIPTVVSFETLEQDTAHMGKDTTTILIPKDGTYLVASTVRLSALAGGYRELQARLLDTSGNYVYSVETRVPTTGIEDKLTAMGLLPAKKGMSIKIQVQQNAGTITVTSGYVAVVRVGD